MRYALMTEPQQGYSYQDILDAAEAAKAAGFEAFFRSDHYSSFPGRNDQPATDAWATLAGLARDIDGSGLGSMVSPVTFRYPGSFAKVVATVDEMAGPGRVEMGVGAGWNEGEHAALGLPYPDTVERVDRLEEELNILRGLWDEPDGWAFDGEHYQVRDALFRPRGKRPNLIVGGTGLPRSCRLGATYADEYNISSSTPAEVIEITARLDAACEKQGRDPRTLTRSVMAGVLIGRDEAEVQRRTSAQMAVFGEDGAAGEAWLDERRDRWVLGTPEAARARIAEYESTGIDLLLLQDFLPADTDHIAAMGELIGR
jgi:alkanesulfonate monooxygenase SsuD/methylene tetrahydromethanopterin reductase-like flavin-dependent oxidoreductase (luciferase family)